jgi:transposase
MSSEAADRDIRQVDSIQGIFKPMTLPECHAVIEMQSLQIEQLREQVAIVQERLKLDSRNSSKPPSSDGPGRVNRAQRRASERKRGAQKGHPGSLRKLVPEAEVTSVQDCRPSSVCECGGAVAAKGKPVRHQVFDIPPVVPEVREYRLFNGVCAGCGRTHRAALPAGVPSGQIGTRALALIGVLGTHYHLTQFKIRDLLARVMGLDFSVGAISQAHGKVAQALAAPVEQVGQYVQLAPLKHLDETRYLREGSANWAWVVVTPKVVQYSVLPSRARYVAHGLIGEQPTGIVVSDRYAVYDYVDAAKRQVCWAHLLRDFKRIGQRAGQAGRIGRAERVNDFAARFSLI